ncbi:MULTISPECIES: response regulator transcription factor [unclassified Crossiella]|uniref:response regulator n=1 Tax=unclassified Crossiella TaxID=2620835 RepID=UPI001FFFC49C|nr:MULTISPECIES: response regulator transcription factor [unclassified Crossiella]MCK2243342.1 response regulator transcription factor [Crossiella sp. S99.2]MCK2254189.1 response regulator transcription factor [Crossiella sp. S99.1]
MSLSQRPGAVRPGSFGQSSRDGEPRAQAIKVLVVDRHPIVADGLRACFAQHSDIEFAGALQDAAHIVDEVTARRPDVVLVDLDLGEVDGLEVVKAVLRTRLPIVAVVFSDQRSRVGAALQAGAMGFVLKCATGEEIVSAIRQARSGVTSMSPQLSPLTVTPLPRAQIRSVLSGRELDVLRLVAEGHTNAEIGRRLFVAETTVKTHLQRIFAKLHVSDRAAAVATALATGLLVAGPDGFGGQVYSFRPHNVAVMPLRQQAVGGS